MLRGLQNVALTPSKTCSTENCECTTLSLLANSYQDGLEEITTECYSQI